MFWMGSDPVDEYFDDKSDFIVIDMRCGRVVGCMVDIHVYSSSTTLVRSSALLALLDAILWKYFNNTRQPFSILILGKVYYVITSPLDVTSFYSNTTTLSWDGFLNYTLHSFGVSPKRLEDLWARPEETTVVNPYCKCLIHLMQDLHKQHLLPDPTFGGLIKKYKASLRDITSWDELIDKHGLAASSARNPFSLYDLCAQVMIDATQLSLFDPILFAIDPTMTDDMRTFTDQLWKLMYDSPFLGFREIKALREKYTRAFSIYQRLPKEMRRKEAWIVTTLIDQYKQRNIHEDDIAAMLFMLHTALIEETSAVVSDNGDIDMGYLVERCPLLRSVYNEALRLRKRDLAFRKVETDTQVGDKVLKGGNFALVPMCQLHDDAGMFGADSDRFDARRFEERTELTSCASFKPYGGGKTYCPGRFFAMQEIFSFVAVMLNRYNAQLEFSSQTFPRMRAH
ncbi:cytochrome P450 [Lojkania enalia]|uniref:Cytochrome P450 n=1 Tax=Lojkania enalia TaxID=147567 RepID=A0A9P4TPA0_9PLEO|nr:cytochrome P450 [Didymosphaeria enalia]